MEVEILKSEYCKFFSKGFEIEYKGKSIIYSDTCLTFLYFYFPSFTRLYVVNGASKKNKIMQVTGFVNKICIFDGKYANRIKKFVEQTTKTENYLYFFPACFIRELAAVINQKKYIYYFNSIYKKYKERYLNGFNYSIN